MSTADFPPSPKSRGEIEPAHPNDIIEPDEFDEAEFDAASINSFAKTNASSSSLASAAVFHAHENGRRYHAYKNARYPIPNDDIEQNREELKHALMLELTDGKHFFAPIRDDPKRIIDLGDRGRREVPWQRGGRRRLLAHPAQLGA